jgi:hypothetical protein
MYLQLKADQDLCAKGYMAAVYSLQEKKSKTSPIS